jgi:hypothetical protein
MDYRRKKSKGDVGIVGTIIIVVFVVLCLTILSTLSFITAYSDLKLTEKTEQITQDYYYINGKAEERLEEIYTILMVEDRNTAIGILEESDYVVMQGVDGKSCLTIEYEVLGDMNQKISVKLNVDYNETMKKPYVEIFSWNLSNVDLPSYEEKTYDLWKGWDDDKNY